MFFSKKAQVNKTNLDTVSINVPEPGNENPFSDRPSTAQQINFNDAETEAYLKDLDKYDNAPAGCDISVWERFVLARRSKINMEDSLRIKNLNFIQMNQYRKDRSEEDENKRKEIEEYSKNALA